MALLSARFSVMVCSHPGPLGGCFSHRKSNKTVRCFLFLLLWCKWMFVYLREREAERGGVCRGLAADPCLQRSHHEDEMFTVRM